MTRRSLLASMLVASLVASLGVAACSQGADPGVRYRPGSNQEDTSATDPAPDDGRALDAAAASDAEGDALPPSDAGSDAPSDAAVDAGPNAFTGAAAYVATTGSSTRKAGHGNNPNPAGRPCLNCHGVGGGATTFTFAGTVYRDAAGTMPSAQVEIRALDQAGKARSVFTDDDGNFFLPLEPDGDLTFPAHVGSRNATATRLMKATITGANCNNCHRPAAAGRLVLP